MMRTYLPALLSGVLLLGGSLLPRASGAVMADTQVTVDNFSFSPAEVTVAPGTRVVWTNRDDIPHTVTDRDPPRAMRSQPLDTGESFSFTFDKPGTYSYFCSLHPHMQGTVVVR